MWGELQRETINNKKVSGRNIFVVKEEFRAFLAESGDPISAFWKHSQNSEMLNIGYVKKSPTNETDESRIRLLQLMINTLVFRGKCEKVYASPCCLVERDNPSSNEVVSCLKGCQGDITDLTLKLHYTQKDIRLVTIDYTGLSTEPEDVVKFLSLCKSVKEITIDHGSSFETLSRYELLKTDSIKKFKCRTKYVPRSRTPA